MYTLKSILMVAFLLCFVGGCSDNTAPNSGANGGDGDDDATVDDSSGGQDTSTDSASEVGSVDTSTPDAIIPTDTSGDAENDWDSCIPHPLGEELCNGFDDTCDGVVDEGCTCMGGTTQPCYLGNPIEVEYDDARCQTGTQECELEFWGACEDAVGPVDEICDDDIDNDCDGDVDEGCEVLPPEVTCPEDFTGPVLRRYTLLGVYADPTDTPMASAYWSQISWPPGHSHDLVSSGLEIDFLADVMGEYRFRLTVENTNGLQANCETTFNSETDDILRIELYWNPDYVETAEHPETTDIDLHLLRYDNSIRPIRYFERPGDNDNCYWDDCATCEATYSALAEGGYYEDREEACRACVSGDWFWGDPDDSSDDVRYGTWQCPPGGADDEYWPPPVQQWEGAVHCVRPIPPVTDEDQAEFEACEYPNDPRLDLDDVEGYGPENINVRRPDADTYRIGVHYYDRDGFAPPPTGTGVPLGRAAVVFLRVRCGGEYVFDNSATEGFIMYGDTDAELDNDFWEVGELEITYDGEIPTCTFIEFGDYTQGCYRVCDTRDANSGGCDPVAEDDNSLCSDGCDNDQDGLIDCDDVADCAGFAACL